MVGYNNKFIIKFESYEILYNMKHKDYPPPPKKKRLEVYNNISEAINTVHEECTAVDIKKKLNGL